MKTLLIKSILILSLSVFCFASDLIAQGRSQERPGRSSEAPGRNKNKVAPGRNKNKVAPGRNKGATGVPIDGGASVLLAAGTAYGLKKLVDSRKQRKQKD